MFEFRWDSDPRERDDQSGDLSFEGHLPRTRRAREYSSPRDLRCPGTTAQIK
jgi:hypothetical protein